jgi:uncharacterized protein (TIGR03435 family)
VTPASLSPIWSGGVRELCNHLWQSTLFLSIIALLAFLLRKNQARIRYWLWMTTSAKFLIPFSLLVNLGSHLPWPSHAAAPKTKAAGASSPKVLLYPQGVMIAQSITMADLTHDLQSIFGQPVVDKTGLDGRWDFTMKWTPDETQFADVPEPLPRPADDTNAPPPLFTAIQKQLGLKLESQKADVPVLVVDHVEHPSPN